MTDDLVERVQKLSEDMHAFINGCAYPTVLKTNLEWFGKYPVCPAVVPPQRRCGEGDMSKISSLGQSGRNGQEVDLGCAAHPWHTQPQYNEYKQAYDAAFFRDTMELKKRYQGLLDRLDHQIAEWLDAHGNEHLQQLFDRARSHLEKIKADFVGVMGGLVR